MTVTEPTTLTVNSTLGCLQLPHPPGLGRPHGCQHRPLTVSGEPVLSFLTVGTQTCTGTTNSAGIATCNITPSEPTGGYTRLGQLLG